MYLTAAEAILPAIQRTRTFLFRPFRWTTYLKLCLVALLTEGLGSNNNFSHSGGDHSSEHGPVHFQPEWIPLIIAAALAIAIIALVIFYLITRLRFAYFHCLVHNIRQVSPGWHLYRTQARRFFWLNIVIGLCYLLLLLLVALPFIGGFVRLFHQTQAGIRPDVGTILTLVLPLIPLILLLVILGYATDIVLRDFMLPHFALENATAGQAWAAVWARIRTQMGPFVVYALLRMVLPIIGAIVLFAVLIIPGILFVAVTAMFEVAIHSVFSGTASLQIFLEVLVGLVAFAVALLVGICFGGPLSTATREYALIFYGGRYQPLGDTLFPSPSTTQA